MAHTLASRRRAAPAPAPAPVSGPAAEGVYVTAQSLAALEGDARHVSLRPRRRMHNVLSGRHQSRIRGRGLDFEELRPYVAGDDVRTIDSHDTARMRRAFVRCYTEEKDRPSTLVVDQRINMFFGSRRLLKSVTAAETVALCGWRLLADGDRVGGIVFDDATIEQQRPERSRGALLRWLGLLADRNRALRADSPATRNPSQLDVALRALARVAHHDHLIVIATDCDGHGDETDDLLRRIAAHNDVVLCLVYDPFFHQLPESGDLVITDGELQVEVGLATHRIRQSITKVADERMQRILGWKQKLGVTVLPLSTGEETPAQLRHFLARATGRGGR